MKRHLVFVDFRGTCGLRSATLSSMSLIRIMVFLFLSRCSHAVQVIGENQSVVLGQAVILSCKVIDTMEALTQISWKRSTREAPLSSNFYTILPKNEHDVNNEHNDDRFKFIGDLERNGSLLLPNATLQDEGNYTCSFTLFPSGSFNAKISLKVLVPPVTHVKDDLPVLDDHEISLATCSAAGSRPPAVVTWITGTLTQKLRPTTSYTHHENGTTTTVSSLLGVPTRGINQHVVHCVVNSPALSKEETIPFTIQVNFSPRKLNITTKSKDSFQCVAEANPIANVTWIRSDQRWPQSAIEVEGATLRFLGINSDLDGLYQCEVSNSYGSDRAYVFVRMTSGACTACWTLLGILLFLNVTAAAMWYLHKYGILQRILECIHNDPHGTREPEESQRKPEELEDLRSEPLD